ncbi:hypothetical protein [Microcoleus sp. CAWBG640]|uniref:hypothetical protein n=1 Tax=Microcoleus sp. CAWBG640 TaxID=2841653 RepID=UPI00312B9F41
MAKKKRNCPIDRTHAPQIDTATPKHPVPTRPRTKQRLAPIYVFGLNSKFYAKSGVLLQNFTLAHQPLLCPHPKLFTKSSMFLQQQTDRHIGFSNDKLSYTQIATNQSYNFS